MTDLWLVGIMLYIFAVGYFAARGMEKFLRGNPGGFPGIRRILKAARSGYPCDFEDDRSGDPCYNEITNIEELSKP